MSFFVACPSCKKILFYDKVKDAFGCNRCKIMMTYSALFPELWNWGREEEEEEE